MVGGVRMVFPILFSHHSPAFPASPCFVPLAKTKEFARLSLSKLFLKTVDKDCPNFRFSEIDKDWD
jgi:hypothetical protein